MLSDTRENPAAKNKCDFESTNVHGHIGVVKLLLSDSQVNPAADSNEAIRLASGNGHIGIVRLLLSDTRVNPDAFNNEAIKCASGNGHIGVVKLILSDTRVNPADDDNAAIRYASQSGHFGTVKSLLSDTRVNPAADNIAAIRFASGNGYTETMCMLMQYARSSLTAVQASKFMSKAIVPGHVDGFALLYRHQSSCSRSTMKEQASWRINLCAEHGRVEIFRFALCEFIMMALVEVSDAIFGVLEKAQRRGHHAFVLELLKSYKDAQLAHMHVDVCRLLLTEYATEGRNDVLHQACQVGIIPLDVRQELLDYHQSGLSKEWIVVHHFNRAALHGNIHM
jgi:hypothetical protein